MDMGMTDADYTRIMEEANASALEHDRQQRQKREEALAYVATIVGARKLKHINEFIDDCDYTCEFEIADSHAGNRQDEPGTAFRYIYLDQYSNGGMSGDDFAGWVWIPLPKGKYLKFHYS
ncbi:hypothetical protein [Pseudomonas amygdali]|uniref:hypothetical protein n=1 Tax=Pseudomonas amygdali TaxID=47877 RepID=UPI000C339621|nr:hypothetical protein [Pseudomonas amygdali]PWD01972.1 hypothetical protein CX658_18625 [Pseudomonas amygdali pv. lachrymans]